MKTLKIISKIIPFVVVIILNIFAIGSGYRIENIVTIAASASVALLINLFIIYRLKTYDHFSVGVSSVAILGIIALFTWPLLGQLYIKNIIPGLYIGLFLSAVIPLLFNKEPFTVNISKKDYPIAIIKSDLFRKVNNIMSYVWAGLFLTAFILSILSYSEDSGIQIIMSSLIPAIPLLAIGIPATKTLPPWLNRWVSSKPMVFNTLAEAFEAMPFGINKKLAKGIDTTIQFEFFGNEAGTKCMTIKNQECTVVNGDVPNPKTIIKSDSQLWLDITNGKISGDEAYINDKFTIEGDASIMMIFADLFSPVNEIDIAEYKPRKINYDFKTFSPGKIKRIVVFDGGPRNSKFSKTTLIVDNFIKGAENAGAKVEYFKLKNLNIHDCTGCYTCWTKTPGSCIFKDDMTLLREKFRSADLVVFASPLYFFNVTGIMKSFMDRLLPLMKPYMLLDEKGYIKHPDRFPEKGEQGFVIFSAAGFPDIDHNFDALQSMYRLFDSHSENIHLMGEFFLTAAEVVVQPIYSQRLEEVKRVCQHAGEQVVKEGRIDKDYMQRVSFPWASRTKFQRQADAFWKSLVGKGRYMTKIYKIE